MKRNTSTTGTATNNNSINIQQQRKRICQGIQYSPIFNHWKHSHTDGDDYGGVADNHNHDTIGELLCSTPSILQQQQHPSAPPPTITNDDVIHQIQNAMIQVTIWNNRVARSLPHAIDCTVSLVQVLLRDYYHYILQLPPKNTSASTPTTTTNELRHLYSSIIVRCINGFADTLQQHRTMATSIANLCHTIGIPKWMVTIRHEATHNALPSLGLLRVTAKLLLQYISTIYWQPMHHQHVQQQQQAQLMLQRYDKISAAVAAATTTQRPTPKMSVMKEDDGQSISGNNNNSSFYDSDDDDDDDKEAADNDALMDDTHHYRQDEQLSMMIRQQLLQFLPGATTATGTFTTSNRFEALLLLDSKPKKVNHQKQTSSNKIGKNHQHQQEERIEIPNPPLRSGKKQKTERDTTTTTTILSSNSNSNRRSSRTDWKYQQQEQDTGATPDDNQPPLSNNNNNNNNITVAMWSKEYMKSAIHTTNTNNHVSINTLQDEAIHHIIQRTKQYSMNSVCCTETTTSTTGAPVLPMGDEKRQIQQQHQQHKSFLYRYRPLLGSMIRIWPGFCSRFVSVCVHEMIHMNIFRGSCGDNYDDDDDGTATDRSRNDTERPSRPIPTAATTKKECCELYCTMIEGWVHLLVSTSMLKQIDVPPNQPQQQSSSSFAATIPELKSTATSVVAATTASNSKQHQYTGPSLIFNHNNTNRNSQNVAAAAVAPMTLLRQLQYPINRLCDQLVMSLPKSNQHQQRDRIENDNDDDSNPSYSCYNSYSEVVRCRIIHLFECILCDEHRSIQYGIDDLIALMVPPLSSSFSSAVDVGTIIDRNKSADENCGIVAATMPFAVTSTTTTETTPSANGSIPETATTTTTTPIRSIIATTENNCNNTSTKIPSKQQEQQQQMPLSLEDMEELLFCGTTTTTTTTTNDNNNKNDTTTNDEQCTGDDTNVTVNTTSIVPLQQQQQQQQRNDTIVMTLVSTIPPTTTTTTTPTTPTTPSTTTATTPATNDRPIKCFVSNWVQCQTWEPCCIGTTFLV